jgi:hypothetical protein
VHGRNQVRRARSELGVRQLAIGLSIVAAIGSGAIQATASGASVLARMPRATAFSAVVPNSVVTRSSVAHAVPRLGPWGNVNVPAVGKAVHAAPAPAHWVHSAAPHLAGTTETDESSNWAGLVDEGPTFTGISASWMVPAIQPSADTEATSNWIGIDGATNSSLIQTGTAEENYEGATYYYAWYELLPNASVPVGDVSPGDEMSASVVQDSPGEWTVTIDDLSADEGFTQELAYSTPQASAEWIEEAPTDGDTGLQIPLANFGSVQFSDLALSTSGSTPVTSTPVDMVNDNNSIIAFPSNFADDGFVVTYGPPATTTSPSVNPTEATVGDSVTYSATVSSSGGTPTGTVTFSVGSTPLCTTLALVSASASCASSAAPVGSDTVSAVYSGDSTFNGSAGTIRLPVFALPGVYVPVAPVRVCDTRPGNPSNLSGNSAQCSAGTAGQTLRAGGTLTFDVAGEFGVPASDVTAVVLNVTTVNAQGSGYFTLFPAGQPRPTASNLNYVAGQVVPNLVEVGVGNGGAVSLFSPTSSDAVIDLEGYVTTASQGGAGLYNALATPARICDTRGSNPSSLSGGATQCNTNISNGSPDNLIGPSNPLTIAVAGDGGVPATGVSAVVLNVTVASPSGPGYVTAYPTGNPRPTASNVNFSSGQVVANRVTVPVSTDGKITLFAAASTDIIVDVSGFYTATGGKTGAEFTPEVTPVRICDTRGSNGSNLVAPYTQCNTDIAPGSPDNPLVAGSSRTIQSIGLGDVPAGTTAVALNVTDVDPAQGGYLTVYPSGTPPTTSDLNPPPGTVAANLVVATLTGTGTFQVANRSLGTTDLVVDVAGWYS